MKPAKRKLIWFEVVLGIFLLLFLRIFSFNNFISDLRFKIRGPIKPSGDVVVVAIDEDSLSQIGGWPWKRDLLALLTHRIFELGAKNIGFDMLFTDKYADQAKADSVFSSTLERYASQITLAWFKDDTDQSIHRSLDLFSKSIKSQGFVNSPRDPDGIYRTVEYFMTTDRKEPCLALALVSQRAGATPENLVTRRSSPIRHLGPAQTVPYISALEILKDNESNTLSKLSQLKGKTVLIGVAATGVGDVRTTPFGSSIPGVEIQAAIAEQILKGHIPKDTGILEILMGISFIGLLIFLGAKFSIKPFLIYSSFAIVIYLSIDFFVLFPKDYFLNSGAFYVSSVFVVLSNIGAKYYEETEQKRFIRQAFSRYLAPEVVKRLISQPESLKLGGEKKELTVLFCDLRNFTTVSETLEPVLLTQLINETFTLLTAIIFKHKGTVDKYIGDAVMAFFGAPIDQPDQALLACHAAIEMAEEFQKKQPEFKKKYGVELSLGIGINTGMCLVGNIGSEQRFSYSTLGDPVNIAARVESCNKEFGTKLLITQSVLDAIQKEKLPAPNHRFVSSLTLKGRSTSTSLFELLP